MGDDGVAVSLMIAKTLKNRNSYLSWLGDYIALHGAESQLILIQLLNEDHLSASSVGNIVLGEGTRFE